MTDMFVSLGTWNWLIFGFILMALEVIAPGVFLFWLGLAALLVGLISFAVVISWQIQLVMFAVFAAAAVPVWRRLARPQAGCKRQPLPQQAHRGAVGPRVHAGEADHRRQRHRAHRRHGVACGGPGYAGGHASEGGAGGWREPDGGCGVVAVIFAFCSLAMRRCRSRSLGASCFHLSANRCSGMNVSRSSRPSGVSP